MQSSYTIYMTVLFSVLIKSMKIYNIDEVDNLIYYQIFLLKRWFGVHDVSINRTSQQTQRHDVRGIELASTSSTQRPPDPSVLRGMEAVRMVRSLGRFHLPKQTGEIPVQPSQFLGPFL